MSEDVVTVQLLVTDQPQLGFIAIFIVLAKNDVQTLIQLIQHLSKRIKRGSE